MRLRNRLIKGTFLNFIAVVFNQGSTFLVNIIVARILLKNIFGEYAMVQSTLFSVAFLAELATGYTAAKYIAEFRTKDPARAGRIMGLCALITLITAVLATIFMIISSPWLSENMLDARHLATPLIIGSGYLFFSCINGYQSGALSGLEGFSSLARSGIFSGVFTLASISLGAYFGGLNGAVAGLSISALFRCIINNIFLRKESLVQSIEPQYKGSLRSEKQILLRFAVPAAISGLYMAPMIWLAQTFLVKHPDGYGEIALFSASNIFRSMVLFLPNIINNVSLSMLNNEKGNGDTITYNKLYRTNVLVIFLSSLFVASLLGFFAPAILQLFGKDFGNGYEIMRLLMLAGILECLSMAVYQYIQSQEKIWLSFFIITFPMEACLVIIAWIMIPQYGGAGLAIAYICSASLRLILTVSLTWYIRKSNSNPELIR